MTSKTPKFEKVLNEYRVKLELDENGGQRRTCRFSSEKFYVRPEDIKFYKRIGVPLPTLSPKERRRQRLSIENGYNLFRIKSAYSGKQMISMYPPNTPYKIYEFRTWISDAWDPFEFGCDYSSEKSFFDQFHQLQLSVPRKSLAVDVSNINSDYANSSKNLKDCYAVFDQNGGENLYYHQCCQDDKNCVECWALDHCDTCYGSKFLKKCFNCFVCEQSRDCMDSYFLWDCRNCTNCFMSSGLRNKKWYFRNKYVGPEKYKELMKNVYLGKWSNLQKLTEEFNRMKLASPRKPMWNEKSVNVESGDYIVNSKNIYSSIYTENSENLAYSEGVFDTRDSMDIGGLDSSELCYEASGLWGKSNYYCKFSMEIDNCREVEYSDSCKNCVNVFGCIGLTNKSFCIFNKQYTESEYWQNVDELKTAMFSSGEYGEFFPPKHRIFPYRITILTSFPGLDDLDEAKRYGYDASEVPQTKEEITGDSILSDNLPDDIADVGDDILDKIIHDKKNNKYYRVIKPELDFYRRYKVPLPREHASIRMERWRKTFKIRNKFFKRPCMKCSTEIETGYDPKDPEIVYCEKCYQQEVI